MWLFGLDGNKNSKFLVLIHLFQIYSKQYSYSSKLFLFLASYDHLSEIYNIGLRINKLCFDSLERS